MAEEQEVTEVIDIKDDTLSQEAANEAAAAEDGAAAAADEPTTDAAPAAPSIELEILSDQFHNYYRIGEAYLKTLQRPKDVEVGTNLLRRVQRLNDSKSLEVKRNNNCFFRYCLKVLRWTSENQPLDLYKSWYRHTESTAPVTESRTWLEDNKSYMAIKYLKDGTYVIYGAVAEDPSAGWQDGGLNILAKKGACERTVTN